MMMCTCSVATGCRRHKYTYCHFPCAMYMLWLYKLSFLPRPMGTFWDTFRIFGSVLALDIVHTNLYI